MDQYISYLRNQLTPVRFQHSLGVMQVMKDLSAIYSLDEKQAMTAGLLHDAAKDLSLEAQLELSKEAGIEIDDPCETHPIYLHAPLGAYLAARDLGIHDQPILDAIAAHSFSDGVNNQ